MEPEAKWVQVCKNQMLSHIYLWLNSRRALFLEEEDINAVISARHCLRQPRAFQKVLTYHLCSQKGQGFAQASSDTDFPRGQSVLVPRTKAPVGNCSLHVRQILFI